MKKMKTLFLITIICLLVSCNPKRWDHVDIVDLKSNEKWEDVQILATSDIFSNTSWVRFKTKEDKQITLGTNHYKFLYR